MDLPNVAVQPPFQHLNNFTLGAFIFINYLPVLTWIVIGDSGSPSSPVLWSCPCSCWLHLDHLDHPPSPPPSSPPPWPVSRSSSHFWVIVAAPPSQPAKQPCQTWPTPLRSFCSLLPPVDAPLQQSWELQCQIIIVLKHLSTLTTFNPCTVLYIVLVSFDTHDI